VAKKVAFDDLGAHRFWLDVKKRNTRAKALYDGEGFVVEGELREAVKVAGGFDSLVVLSMLHSEYAARRAQALELPA
jgi:RimJ/RimL family protein N-acetyltransferase